MASENGTVTANEEAKPAEVDFRGFGPQMQTLQMQADFLTNVLVSRVDALRKLLDPDNKNNLDQECGYPDVIGREQYRRMFDRSGLARRIVRLEPRECWKTPPEVYETEEVEDETGEEVETPFEEAWNNLVTERRVWHYLRKADELSGIGSFGILLFGFNDGGALDTPVPGINESTGEAVESRRRENMQLLYLRAFSEDKVRIEQESYEPDSNNPRFGRPRWYLVKLGGRDGGTEKRVHWTRCLHLAEDCIDDEVFGTPRLQEVFDRLLDLRKTLGGSAEMFYRGGFPGLSVKMNPNIPADAQIDMESVKKAFQDYIAGFQRFIALAGMEASSLAVSIADPTPHLDGQYGEVALAKGVPLRVLMGSERGELASTQDQENWNDRVRGRQNDYLTPFEIQPFIDRLIMVGVLPDPDPANGYTIAWPDPDAPTDKDKAEVGLNRTKALAEYMRGNVSALIAPVQFMVSILGMPQAEAQAAWQSAQDLKDEEDNSLTAAKEAEAAAKQPPAGDDDVARDERRGDS